jgi:hypothetical protein
VSAAVRRRLHFDGERFQVSATRRDRDGVCADGHRARSLVKLDLRSERVANVFAILAYAPFLLFLPVLLVLGLVFVVVPGGFIVVLGGFYYAAMGFASLLGLAASRSRQTRATPSRRTRPSFDTASPSSRSSSGRRGAAAVQASLSASPTASPGPSLAGEEVIEAPRARYA